MEAIKLFYSYCEVDEPFRIDLEKSLIMLKRHDGLEEWNFRKILPGDNLNIQINSHLESSQIILLLLSRDFLASQYCYEIEVSRAMELHQAGKLIIIPIVLRECDWQHEKSPFRYLEALPKNALPISKWNDKDSAYNDITQRLKETIYALKQSREKETIIENTNTEVSTKEEKNDLKITIELFKQEAENLTYNSTKEDFDTVQKLRKNIYDQLFKNLDDKIANIPSLKEKLPFSLFQKNIFLR